VIRARQLNTKIEARLPGMPPPSPPDSEPDAEHDDDAAALTLSLSAQREEKEAPPASSARPSSSSPALSPSQAHLFPSAQSGSNKRAREDAGLAEAVQSLATTLSTAISAQLEQWREERKLAREQMVIQQQQMATQQQQMRQLIAALAGRKL
jgi:hypothetical protein